MSAVGLRSLAVRGSMWSIGGNIGVNVTRFASNVILASLLLEEHFGLMALVSVVLAGLEMFSDVGIGPSIVQHPRGEEHRFLRTAWTIQVIRGLALWACVCILAWPVAWLYSQNDPTAWQLLWLLPVAGFGAVFNGFNSTSLFVLQRNIHLRPLMLFNWGLLCLQVVVQIIWAWLYPTVWALVGGGVIHAATRMTLSHVLFRSPGDGFGWDRAALGELVRFGRWIFLSTLLTFFAMQADRLIFGGMIPIRLLGVYAIAAQIALMPFQMLAQLGSNVIFPLYSRLHGMGRELGTVFGRVRWPLLLLGGWMLSGLIAGGPTIMRLFYEERFHEGGWMIQWLVIGLWFSIMEASIGAAMLARGQAYWVALANGAKLLAMIALIPLGYWYAQFPGALAGYAGADVAKYVTASIIGRRIGLRGLKQDVSLTVLVGGAAAAGWFLAELLAGRDLPEILIATAIFVVVSAIWAPWVWPQARELIRKGPPVQIPTSADDVASPTAADARSF